MNIILVEDDDVIASGLSYSLESEGYNVKIYNNTRDCIAGIDHDNANLYILDLRLPDGTGYDICKSIRLTKDTPVIFLSACDDEVNVVMGLDLGADDYITKPFRIRELLSRINTILRRYTKTESSSSIITIDDIKINTSEAKVYKGSTELMLTALEYRLLLTLINNRGHILNRNQLLESIWDIDGAFVNDNTLTVYIKRLREKLEDNPSVPKIIKTVRGLGYVIENSTSN